MTEEKQYEQEIKKVSLEREQRMHYARGMNNSPLDSIVTRSQRGTFIKKYSKETIQKYLANPADNEQELRDVVDYLCSVSPQFDRLLGYLPNMAYIIPFVKQNSRSYTTKNAKKNKIEDFNKMCDDYEMLDIKSKATTILKEVFKYGIYYGLEMKGTYKEFLKKLPARCCKIITSGENGYSIAFDFSYFNGNEWMLDNAYPKQFRELFNSYMNGANTLKGMGLSSNWQPVPSDMTIVIKYDTSVDYIVPPYVNLFNALYDLEEYESLNKAKVTAENFTMIGLKLPYLKEAKEADDFAISDLMIEDTTDMLDKVLPEYMGYFVTGTDIVQVKASSSESKINTVSDARKNVWESQGIASTIFGVDNQTEGTLNKSIAVDEQQLFPIYRQLENHWDYRFKKIFDRKFKFTLLNTTWFNIENLIGVYTSQAQASIPVGIILPLLLGFDISDIDDMVAMQNDIFDINTKWVPLASSFTQNDNSVNNKNDTSPNSKTDPAKGGKPKQKTVTTSGQQSRDK